MQKFSVKLIEAVKKYYYLLTGLLVFIIYLFTLAPSVTQIDSGELATVQAILGIAHPTGYPLFTITGHLFSLIPLPFSTIYQLNLLAALYCSAGVAVFVYTAKLLLDNIDSFKTKTQPEKPKKTAQKKAKKEKTKKIEVTSSQVINETVKYIAAVSAGIMLALSRTFWSQSTSTEVYSLHILLINLIILFLVKAYLAGNDDESGKLKPWSIFAGLLALGFTNHMTTLMIIPGVAYLFFDKYGLSANSFKKIGLMLLVFFPVLILVYLYLPLRASQSPALNWGNPIDFERFIRHVTGKQYQVWLFSSTEAAIKQLKYFIETLPGQYYLSLIVSAIGIFVSFKLAKKLFVFLMITFLFTVFYSINYEIHDIDTYFLLAYISLAFFAMFGVIKTITFIQRKREKYALPAAIVVIVILAQTYFNFGKVNQSNVYTFEDYTKSILSSVPENSVIFSYQWDYFVSASYYFRLVENFRKDVVVVDKELLRRSWYLDQLNKNYPFLFKGMQKTVNEFKEALKPFERGENYNPQLLEMLYRRLMTELVATNVKERAFYVAPELFESEMQRKEFMLPNGYALVPDLFLFKVVNEDTYSPVKLADFKLRLPDNRNYYINMIEQFTGAMLARRAVYEMQKGNKDKANFYLKKIKDELPDYRLPFNLRNGF